VAEVVKRQHVFEAAQLKGLSILDVGCGGGLLSESLARLGANVTSIDPSPENIRVASTHSSADPATAHIRYKQSTIGNESQVFILLLVILRCAKAYVIKNYSTEEVLASGEKFDVVCALEVRLREVGAISSYSTGLWTCSELCYVSFAQVIEHVDEPRGFIQTCAQCVQSRDGAPGSLFVSTMNKTKKAHLMAVVGAEYVLGMIPPGRLKLLL
jgi:2-polyprenyl-3-methyl-5-hydroxy-6-metoxy-1,4-benzoquinol methylase